jgi:hypothetical protein
MLRSLIFRGASCIDAKSKKEAPESGFEPESEPRQGFLGLLSGFKAYKLNISGEELNSQQRETLATLAFKYTKKELDSHLSWQTRLFFSSLRAIYVNLPAAFFYTSLQTAYDGVLEIRRRGLFFSAN